MRFQPVSWEAVRPDDDETDAATIFEVYGRTPDGESVMIRVSDFRPHFLVRIPGERRAPAMARNLARSHREKVAEALRPRAPDAPAPVVTVEFREDMWGFQFGDTTAFLRVTAPSDRAFFSARKSVSPGGELYKRGYRAYESNVDPTVSMLHRLGVGPCSVIECDFVPAVSRATTCDIEGSASCDSFRAVELAQPAPLVIAAFDIEAYSADGRFPTAVKDLRGVAQGLCDAGDLAPVFDGSLLADLALRTDRYLFHPPERFAELARRREAALAKALAARDDERLARELLECIVPGKSTFRDATRPDPLHGDPVIQIGTTIHRYGEDEPSDAFLVCLGKEIAPVRDARGEEVRVLACETERDVLLTWARELRELGPDVLTSWNGFGFDWPFLRDRAEQLDCLDAFLAAIGRNRYRPSAFVEKDLSSSALGDNHLRYIDPVGTVSMDLMKVVQADYKLDSYRLDAVAREFVGEAKNDLPPNEIFARFRTGTPEALAEIASYCVQDCALVSRLTSKLRVLEGKVGMANVCRVPLEYLFTRGQQIKIFSVVLFEAAAAGYAVPDISRDPALGRPRSAPDDPPERCARCPSTELTCAPPDSVVPHLCAECAAAENREAGEVRQTMVTKYEGAIVLDPEDGGRVFADEPVVCLDYGSLYPSCMLARQMCHSSFVLDPADFDAVREDARYQTYETEFELFGPDAKPCGVTRRCMFAWDPKRPRPILPRVLEKLLRARKVTRARIKEQVVRIDGREVHGLVERRGDAVVVTDPETRAAVAEGVPEEPPRDRWSDFEKSTLDGLQLGFKVVCNSLYGACGAGTSPTGGLVGRMIAQCVTREGRNMIHLAKNFVEEQYAARVVYGDSVTDYTPVTIRADGRVQVVRIADLADRYGAASGWLPMDAPGREGKEACELVGVETWTERGWTPCPRVIRHALAPGKRIVRVVTRTAVVDCTDEHSLVHSDGSSVHAGEVSVGTRLLHHPVAVGGDDVEEVWGASGERQIDAARAVLLARARGVEVGLDVRDGVVRVTTGTQAPRDPDAVREVLPVDGYTGYVFDLTTENHHYQAGVGSMIVHNTDSVFVVFPNPPGSEGWGATEVLAHANRCGLRAEEEIAAVLPKPHVLEAEKVLFPLLLVSKKRYAGVLYEMWDPDDPAAAARAAGKAKLKTMGLKLKRRDSAPVTRRVLKGLIDTFIETRDVAASLAYMDRELTRFARGDYDPEEIVMSQVLRAWYRVPPSHKYLADRMNKRAPGSVQANDRIPYVFIKGPRDALIRDRIEAPDYAREHGMKIDLRQYLESQLVNPLSDIVGILLTPPEDVRARLAEAGADRTRVAAVKKKWLEKVFAKYLKMADGNTLITQFFRAR